LKYFALGDMYRPFTDAHKLVMIANARQLRDRSSTTGKIKQHNTISSHQLNNATDGIKSVQTHTKRERRQKTDENAAIPFDRSNGELNDTPTKRKTIHSINCFYE